MAKKPEQPSNVRILKTNPFPMNNTKTPPSEINKAYHSRTLPEEPKPFVSKKQPEQNPLAFNYQGVDSKRRG